MRVLVTGTEGYIGTVLVPMLIEAGHEVTGLDTGFYRDGWLFSRGNAKKELPRTLLKDLRNIEASDIAEFDAIVHMAELSNDPLGANNPDVTHEINHLGSVQLAELAKKAGVRRFVYTSSCAVYGVSDAEFVDENSPPNPQTAYAECKVLVERDVSKMADNSFCPVFLRNATAYGASPRMRFDIVLNNLMGWAWTTKRVAMTSDGSPWRPLVHVQDICTAIKCALAAPTENISGEILNVGRTEDNHRIREVAEVVSNQVPGCEVTFGAPDSDNRSYRVKFDKIRERLPGYECSWDIEAGARELRGVFEQIGFDSERFGFRAFTRLEQLKYLTATGQIDGRFFWKY